MTKTVEDMYNYCKANNVELLSNYNADFWADYRTNFGQYDFLFRRLFRSFVYFMQPQSNNISELVDDFRLEVKTHLLVNDKKYSELYRINVLDDSTYSMLDNYNVTETLNRSTSENGTVNSGQRTDTSSNTSGAHTDSNSAVMGATKTKTLNGISPYNEEHQGSSGTHISIADMYDNTSSATETDSHTDTNTIQYGAQTDSASVVKGAQSDTTSNTGTESYTLTRVGNIGVQTPTDILDKHKNFWTKFEFYEFIFREIADALLMIGEC